MFYWGTCVMFWGWNVKKKKPVAFIVQKSSYSFLQQECYLYRVCMGHGILWSAVEKKIVISNGKLIMPVSKQW